MVFINLPQTNILYIDIDSKDTVSSLKLKIEELAKISAEEQNLIYLGKLLKDSKSLSDYSIQSTSVVNLILKTTYFQVLIKKLCGATFTIDVESSFSISQVKEIITLKTGIPAIHQVLQYKKEKLEESHSLSYYKISHLSTVGLIFDDYIRVKIQTSSQEYFTVKLYYTSTVRNLKEEIFKIKGFIVDKQVLISQGKKIIDENLISEYSKELIYLLIRKDIKIFVEICRGKIMTVDLDFNSTVIEIKNQIERKEGILVKNQALVFREDELSDSSSISEIGIDCGSVIFFFDKEALVKDRCLSGAPAHSSQIKLTEID